MLLDVTLCCLGIVMETNVKQIKMFYHIDKNSTLENYNQVKFRITRPWP